MKYYIIIFCLLLVQFSNAQKAELPWELERLTYQNQTQSQNELAELDTYELFLEYYRIYKYRRSIDPEAYALPSNQEQDEIKEELGKSETYEEIDQLIYYLESGKRLHLELLEESEAIFPESYPYRLIAAFTSKNHQKTKEYIALLDQHKMISPVLKSFGLNAVGSGSNQVFISQGIQDLIGILWALDQNQMIGNAIVYNDYANTISKEYQGIEEFLDEYPYAWITPTVNLGFLKNNLKFIHSSGIGFKRTGAQEFGAITEWQWTIANFKGMGSIPANPADKGLIASYHYFLDQLKMNKSNNLEFADLEDELSAYIKEFGGHR